MPMRPSQFPWHDHLHSGKQSVGSAAVGEPGIVESKTSPRGVTLRHNLACINQQLVDRLPVPDERNAGRFRPRHRLFEPIIVLPLPGHARLGELRIEIGQGVHLLYGLVHDVLLSIECSHPTRA